MPFPPLPPYPTAAASMLESMKVKTQLGPTMCRPQLAQFGPRHAFEVPEVLRKITDEQRDEWAEKFAGVPS